jgi:pyroglutamyl-peptidase
MRLARHLGRVRRERFRGVERVVRLLPTTWAMLDGTAAMVADVGPNAVLMFGLASRRRRVTPEARALNRAGPLRPDAVGARPPGRALELGGSFMLTGDVDAVRMTAALRLRGIPAAVSRDAGDYLCNALFYRMAETGAPCIFVHVPRPVAPMRPKGRTRRRRPTMAQLHRAAEAALDQVLLRTRG